MNPQDLETIAKTIEILGKAIGTIGFPAAIAIYLLVSQPKREERLRQEQQQLFALLSGAIKSMQAEFTTSVNGLRSDLVELTRLLQYTDRLRFYGRDDPPRGGDG